MKAINFLVALCFVLSACSPSSEQPTATAFVAQAQTQTAAPTITPVHTPTPKPTTTPIATLTPQEKIINRVKPENPEIYSDLTEAILYDAVTEDQFNKILENVQNIDPVSTCPEVWIEPVPGELNPLYALFINASQEDKEKGYVFAIRSTIPEMELYSIVGIGIIPTNANGKFIMTVKYQPVKGEPNPEELEIQVVFPGCEIYKETVTWP